MLNNDEYGFDITSFCFIRDIERDRERERVKESEREWKRVKERDRERERVADIYKYDLKPSKQA